MTATTEARSIPVRVIEGAEFAEVVIAENAEGEIRYFTFAEDAIAAGFPNPVPAMIPVMEMFDLLGFES